MAAEVVTTKHAWPDYIRSTGVVLLGLTCALAFGTYVVLHWVERQILTTDNWVSLVSPLPKQPVVSTALGNTIGNQLFGSGNIEAKVADALPPKAGFLAGPLTDQLHTLTNRTSQKVVASEGFQTVWEGANRAAMNRLVTVARGQTPPLRSKINQKFDINLSGANGQLSGALGSVSNAIPALQPAAQKALDVSTNLKTKAAKIHQYVRLADTLAVVLPFVIVVSYLAAVAFSRHRRKTTLRIAIAIGVLMLLEIIALKWLRQETLQQVRTASNLSAVGYIFDVLVGWLQSMIRTALVGAVILSGLLLLWSPANWAQSLRSMVRIDRLKNHRILVWWRGVRLWSRTYEYYGWLLAGLVVLVGLAMADSITGTAIIKAVLVAVGLAAAVHIIATPPLAAGITPARSRNKRPSVTSVTEH